MEKDVICRTGVGEWGVMHTLFQKVPSMGSWTFQFNL